MAAASSLASQVTSSLQDITSWELDSQHSGCLLRLSKLLTASSSFRLILLEFNDPLYRDRIIQQMTQFSIRTELLVLDESIVDFSEFERQLAALAGKCEAVHVLRLEVWLADAKTRESRFKGFNYHRETLAELCPFALLLWMTKADIKDFALRAPDLWAWRTDVLDLSLQPAWTSTPVVERAVERGSASVQNRQARIKEIEEYLDRESGKDGGSALLRLELGQLYNDLGDSTQALIAFQQALAVFRELDDRRQAAMAQVLIADIKASQGNTEYALKIYKEIVKLFDELGATCGRGGDAGKIADVLQDRGELDEALRIRREEQLPV
ncbi:MAG: tetratricopeptide repeat protein, partial [Synechococcaceae cyanobacterium SM1_2_3]|nr:tetratricopeptide repeat protein [Synechococcaceae cyanobacterium SM1_2_3]